MPDKFENKIFMIAAGMMIVFLFCLLYASAHRKADLPGCIPFDKSYREPKVTQLDDHTYQVFAVAKMWSFEPSTIYIPVGSDVDFYVTSLDVVHGFLIDEKNVNMTAIYGSVTKATAHFDKPGIYKITCHEYCGVGHQNMQAEVVVNYPNP